MKEEKELGARPGDSKSAEWMSLATAVGGVCSKSLLLCSAL